MGTISLITPEQTINLVQNPSIEEATTNYTAVGGSIARVITQQRRGAYSLEITPTAGVNDGAFYATVSLTSGSTYTYSIDVKGVLGIPYRIYFATTAAAVLGTPTTFTGSGAWQRVTVTYTETSTTTRRLYVEKNNNADTGAFYVDGLQCEAKSYDTTFCDGSQDGCEWNGALNASTSTRSAQSRAGGRVIDLSSFNITELANTGLGVMPLKHITQQMALQPGALLQDIKEQVRVIQIAALAGPGTFSAVYKARSDLWDALKPDRVGQLQPVMLRYTHTTNEVEIPCYYDSGLTGDLKHLSHEPLMLRLLAYQPFWQDVGENAVSLDSNDTTAQRYFAARIDDVWDTSIIPSAVSVGAFGTEAIAVAVGPDGKVYIGGDFTNWDGIANADFCAYWDPVTGVWNAMGTGMDSYVRRIVIGPDGNPYFVGNFTTANGVTVRGVTYWNGTTFVALGPPSSGGEVYDISFGLDGNIYICGAFTNWNGDVNADYVAYWNPSTSTWNNMSASGSPINTGTSIMYALDGKVYVGATYGGAPDPNCKYWDTAASSWNTFTGGDGFGGVPNSIIQASNGLIYFGGSFTTLNGDIDFNSIAAFNGSSFDNMGKGTDPTATTIWQVREASNGDIYVCGSITRIGGLDLKSRASIWNGFTWIHLDIALASSPTIRGLALGKVDPANDSNFDLYLAVDDSVTSNYSGTTTVTNNGSAKAFPIITLKRSGGTSAKLIAIRNETTGIELNFDLDFLDGETVVIDLSPGKKTITSDFRGNVIGQKLPGPGLSEFALLPGANLISLFIDVAGAPTVTSEMRWRDLYWSVDGAN